MPEVIMCTKILTRSPFALSLIGFHGPTLELATVLLITIVVCLCAVLQGTYDANKTRTSRVVVYLKFAKRHTRELNWYCHLAVLRQITWTLFSMQ